MIPAGVNPGQQMLELRDIHLPPAPHWWPPAPGWWLLAAVLLVLLVAAGFRLHDSLQRRHRKREILNRLATLEREFSPDRTPQFLAEVSTLLRRVAVHRYSRKKVASLSGDAWLQFLDDTGGAGFTSGAGRLLGEGPYQKSIDADPAEILPLAKAWIGKNLPQKRRKNGS